MPKDNDPNFPKWATIHWVCHVLGYFVENKNNEMKLAPVGKKVGSKHKRKLLELIMGFNLKIT